MIIKNNDTQVYSDDSKIDFILILIAQNMKAIDNYFLFCQKYNTLKTALMLRSAVHNKTEVRTLYNYFESKNQEAKLIINTFIDLPSKVYHLNSSQLNDENFMKQNIYLSKNFTLSKNIYGASCHNIHEIRLAEQYKLDYITYSPIFHTNTHVNMRGVGLAELNKVCEKTSLKVFALGGVNLLNLPECQSNGAFGGASVSILESYNQNK